MMAAFHFFFSMSKAFFLLIQFEVYIKNENLKINFPEKDIYLNFISLSISNTSKSSSFLNDFSESNKKN